MYINDQGDMVDGPGPGGPSPYPGNITLQNEGAFVCQFKVKTNDHETDWSGHKNASESAVWSYDEMKSFGFNDGDDCWVSCDISAGASDHQSGANFTFKQGMDVYYSVDGTTFTPSWSSATVKPAGPEDDAVAKSPPVDPNQVIGGVLGIMAGLAK